MKKIFIISLLIIAAILPILAKNSEESLTRQISNANTAVSKAEREFEIRKTRRIYDLQKEINRQSALARHLEDASKIDQCSLLVKNLNNQIDSLKNTSSNEDQQVQEKTKFLYALQQQQIEMNKQNISSAETSKNVAEMPKEKVTTVKEEVDRTIPVEISRYHTKRRGNSNNLRRDEIVLAKVEQNMNSIIIPGAPQGGMKVIFENLYISDVMYNLKSSNGFSEKSYTVGPKQKIVHYVIPGIYMVETWINGHKEGCNRTLTVNGEIHDYKGEACFGFVYTPRFR